MDKPVTDSVQQAIELLYCRGRRAAKAVLITIGQTIRRSYLLIRPLYSS